MVTNPYSLLLISETTLKFPDVRLKRFWKKHDFLDSYKR